MAGAHKFTDKRRAGSDADTTIGAVVDLSSPACVMVSNPVKAYRQAPANQPTSTAATPIGAEPTSEQLQSLRLERARGSTQRELYDLAQPVKLLLVSLKLKRGGNVRNL